MSIDGSWEHIASRYVERIEGHEDRFKACLTGLVSRIRKRNVPNRPWYRAVRERKDVLGYICGQGTYISTILGPDMVPHGERI